MHDLSQKNKLQNLTKTTSEGSAAVL